MPASVSWQVEALPSKASTSFDNPNLERRGSLGMSPTPVSESSSPATASSPISLTTGATRVAILSISERLGPGKASGPSNGMAMSPMTGSPLAETKDGKPVTMTSKEWVVPPRPKPGRKPANDTPPTKRKAQNRAAQRAFRERRAARVGELEEQLDEKKGEYQKTVHDLQDRITQLERERQGLLDRCQWLEDLLEKERQDKHELASGVILAEMPSVAARRESVSSADPRPTTQPLSISQIICPPDETQGSDLTCGSCTPDGPCACAEAVFATSSSELGCGKCTASTRCQCFEESMASLNASDLKRPLPPPSLTSSAPDEKRQRLEGDVSLETDFTAMFASKPRATTQFSSQPTPQTRPQVLTSVEPRDSCGFCKDGTYCVCAESAMLSSSTSLPFIPSISQQTQTPPPSDTDVLPAPLEVTATGAIRLPGVSSLRRDQLPQLSRTGGCGPNGPGTCAQCQADPVSGLFCRSLAANFERQSLDGVCCGNGGPGGCCKAGNTEATTAAAPKPGSGLGLSLSCADAYKTLSTHRHFNEATDDLGSWLPKLKVAPAAEAAVRGRPASLRLAPMEVEAASIMAVLKGFDVRFGRGQ